MATRFLLPAVLVLGLALCGVFVGRGSALGEPKLASATFAGGCFWCMEPPYKYYRNGCGRDNRLEELWGKDAGI